jgi:hypothetical protein
MSPRIRGIPVRLRLLADLTSVPRMRPHRLDVPRIRKIATASGLVYSTRALGIDLRGPSEMIGRAINQVRTMEEQSHVTGPITTEEFHAELQRKITQAEEAPPRLRVHLGPEKMSSCDG